MYLSVREVVILNGATWKWPAAGTTDVSSSIIDKACALDDVVKQVGYRLVGKRTYLNDTSYHIIAVSRF